MNSWQNSTKTQYDTYLRQWKSFCKARNTRLDKADLSLGLDFLYHLLNKGLSYSAINTARSAISSVMIVSPQNIDFGSHKLVCQFMKGVFNRKPSLPRYASVWDQTMYYVISVCRALVQSCH